MRNLKDIRLLLEKKFLGEFQSEALKAIQQGIVVFKIMIFLRKNLILIYKGGSI